MIEIINYAKTVTARKSHVCNYCGCIIHVGERYKTSVLKYDTIYQWKNHIRCQELVNKLNIEGDEGVTLEDFYEAISEQFMAIWDKLDPDMLDSKDFKIPPFKEQVEFVYSRISGT